MAHVHWWQEVTAAMKWGKFIWTLQSDTGLCTLHQSTQNRVMSEQKLVRPYLWEAGLRAQRRILHCTSSPHLTYPSTARVGGAPQMASQPVSSFFFSPFSTALWDSVNSRPVHSLMLSSHLFSCLPCFSSPFHCAVQGGFGQTWWTGDISIPLQFVLHYRRSGGLCVVWFHARSWHRLPRW